MFKILLIALGGAIGSVARYSVGKGVMQHFSPGFPWGTLAVNVTGSFLIGLCVHFLPRDTDLRYMIVTGVLGGYTTFSAFSLEAMTLLKSQPFYGVVYVTASVMLSLAAVFFGAKLHV